MTICRSNLILVEDDRNKQGKHTAKNEAWAAHDISVVRRRLPFGDYVAVRKTDIDEPIEDISVSVDTKANIDELAGNLKGQHDRFRNEAIRALEAGCHLVILVENTEGIRTLDDLRRWKESSLSYNRRKRRNVRAERYAGEDLRTAKDGHVYDKGIAHICEEMSRKYGIEFDFCAPDEAWAAVMRHLGVMM